MAPEPYVLDNLNPEAPHLRYPRVLSPRGPQSHILPRQSGENNCIKGASSSAVVCTSTRQDAEEQPTNCLEVTTLTGQKTVTLGRQTKIAFKAATLARGAAHGVTDLAKGCSSKGVADCPCVYDKAVAVSCELIKLAASGAIGGRLTI